MFGCILPFLAMISKYPNSWACLIVSQVGQSLFMVVELIDMYKQRSLDKYFYEVSNISDYVQFIAHTTFFILKYIDLKSIPTTETKLLESEDQLKNSILIMVSLILVLMVTKLQHILNIYPLFGILNELLYKSVS